MVSTLLDSPPHRLPPTDDDEPLVIIDALPLLPILDSPVDPRLLDRVLFRRSCCEAVPVVALELLVRLSSRSPPVVGVLEREDGRPETEDEDVGVFEREDGRPETEEDDDGDLASRLDRDASRLPAADLDSDRDMTLEDKTDRLESFPSRCDLDSDRLLDSGRLLLALEDLTDRASPPDLDFDLDSVRDFPLDDLTDRPSVPRTSPTNLPSSHVPSRLVRLASSYSIRPDPCGRNLPLTLPVYRPLPPVSSVYGMRRTWMVSALDAAAAATSADEGPPSSFSESDFTAGRPPAVSREVGELLASDELDRVRLAVSPALSSVGRDLAPSFALPPSAREADGSTPLLDAPGDEAGADGRIPTATAPGGSARRAGGGAGRPSGSRPGGPAGRLALLSRPALTDRPPPTDALLLVLGELPLGGGGTFRNNTFEDGLPMTECRFARSFGGSGVILSGSGPTRETWKL